MGKVYVIGSNMPGYMPDSDPVEIGDFDEAVSALVEDMKTFVSEVEESIEIIDDKSKVEDLEKLRTEADSLFEVIKTWKAGDHSAYLSGRAFWVSAQ